MKTISQLLSRKRSPSASNYTYHPHRRQNQQPSPEIPFEFDESFDAGVFEKTGITHGKNENRIIIEDISPELTLYGVLAGHGGDCCVEYLHDALPRVFIERIQAGLSREDALKESFLICSEEFDNAPRLAPHRQAGAVALLCLTDNVTKQCYIANAGDCRIFASQNSDSVICINKIHRVDDPYERERVESLGGVICLDHGIPKVQRVITQSRTFGDINVRTKPDGTLCSFLHPDPDIYKIPFPEKNTENGHGYLILSTGSMGDALSEQRISEIICTKLKQGASAEDIAVNLGQSCAHKVEDLSVLVLTWSDM